MADKVEAFHGVWTLNTISKTTKRLRATHMAWIIVYGKSPLWVVTTINRKFVRYAGSRQQIADAYPNLVWRRPMVRWSMVGDVADCSIPKRRELAASTYGRRPPEPQD